MLPFPHPELPPLPPIVDHEHSGALDDAYVEVLDSPDGDPLKRGRITAAQPLVLAARDLHPVPPPPDHPYARAALVVAVPTTDLLLVDDLDRGLAALYEDDRARRDARDARAEYDPRRLRP